ncbi:MAG: polyribonucleotide nucleotidyltransferase [Mogibacterium diversum]|jgi:polyribonucleotide nucleotidyltransferase|uniref:Polyribonucleotide nucleotidyltransferase n=1 Tax=Mogibacterium diversum TaxID=114527 RepID=A0A2S0L3M0_9FIRM|nr:polyribonucleotide nucleotidyltransferase [Mogibacterium diversum]AVM47902.1 polyribonucleotide nucleotidyltransferase [Mogibacterium diversum]MBF1319440.1 polyribonucleotide nucleotidyltransferase [Mogibacterium diversum]MBF1337765.1 polyribonucleotide nucleotidyltransferase [Mogibacterium diversum]MBF1340467.1 polyribonucleotide nucleotidyltransferase [Mogibacterium diversum]MBF1358360.1 polyribonucleotide nucleotidyltransferase [Mogibacterium diversum]
MGRFTDYHTFRTALGGRLLQLEIGKVCEQANGQVTVRYGDTVVNCTATASKQPRQDIDFFPLSCDYEEKMYAVGKIPGGYIKREGRPGEHGILTSRLMDRPLRPLFPKGFRNDVSVVAVAMSVDHDCSPEVAAMIGSSVALATSDIPWDGPTGSVKVGRVDGELIINPTYEQRMKSDIDLTVAGTKEAIMMVEAGANEVSESDMLDAIMFAHEEIKQLCVFIEEIANEVGKEKMEYVVFKADDDVDEAVRAYATDKMIEAIKTFDKLERLENMEKVETETHEHFAEIFEDRDKEVGEVLYAIKKEQVRSMILDEGVRPDNRKLSEIRPLFSETGFLPRAHGTGLFKRGQTQVLSVATLAPLSEAQDLDSIDIDRTTKRYMHQYNFPGYSTGEPKPPRSPGRREIGHGALAERALLPVIPSEEEFPYAIRVVSEVLSSNGSSSMASTCGSCLALMDAGVPIKKPVSGIAMGLIERVEEDGSSRYAILSDIQGMEDFLGDMDFKVTGTPDGITAIQMDIKVHGLSREILEQALEQARVGRAYILESMLEEIAAPRAELSPYAPRCISMRVHPDKVRLVIGPGGKNVNKIVEETGCKVDISDDDVGLISIYSSDEASAAKAKSMIEYLTADVEVGKTYEGEVKRIMNFGAFIEILPGKEGLLHISKIANHRVDKVEDVMNIGDKVVVKVTEIDNQNRINLSRRELVED